VLLFRSKKLEVLQHEEPGTLLSSSKIARSFDFITELQKMLLS
jgi:hypothetical protein